MDKIKSSNERPTILVVDDAPDNLALISDLLKSEYKVRVANNGQKALEIAKSDSPPDLILLDIMMPVLDGYEVCKELKKNEGTKNIPVIFLTARTDIKYEKYGLELGAEDYITKPFSPPVVMARVKTHLNLSAASAFLRDKNQYLTSVVESRAREVIEVQEVTILVLASLAETRDTDTGNHLLRTQRYVRSLAMKLKTHSRFKDKLTDNNIDLLFKSAPLHDIGKVGIPDSILLKPGSLEPGEFEIMKTHAKLGRDAIEKAEKSLGTNVGFLSMAKEIAHHHHEKWDGTGYPDGLSGDNISVFARLMALADVYDALSCDRIYRKGLPHEKVYQIIMEGRGTHFDPDIVNAFIELQDEFKEIAGKYADTETDPTGYS